MEDVIFNPYEVGEIINENRRTVVVSYNKLLVKQIYDKIVEKAKISHNHHIVFIYDYEKNANIEYYDNESEVC